MSVNGYIMAGTLTGQLWTALQLQWLARVA